ncbi:MAG: HPF/RaiA family ribosome-associated protein [Thalassotalea sp.]
MKIDIQNSLVEVDQTITADIQRRLRLALSKMESNISSITFKISDVAERNSKFDKYCSLTISLYGISDVVVEETQTDLHCAIDRVIQKAARHVARKLGRVD